MGKENQLLEAAASGNLIKVEKLLGGTKWKKPQRITADDDEEQEEPPFIPVIEKKIEVTHINVNCTDENGSTPLILASLNGHRDIVYVLLQYSAGIHATDGQGNSALHMAAWQNRPDVVELLLLNGASVDLPNAMGSTALHFACQYCQSGKPFSVIKLLQGNANIYIRNCDRDNALDLASRFDKREAVSLLIDSDVNVIQDCAHALVEACRNGRKEVVETFLESGADPNCVDERTGTSPLHEAVRFFRLYVAELLLQFGAKPGVTNSGQQSALDIAMGHPEAKRQQYIAIFEEYNGKAPRIPRVVKEKEQLAGIDKQKETLMAMTYPLLKNKKTWTSNSREYCSATTEGHPCTNLLDDDPCSLWIMPGAGAYNWVVFDFTSVFTLTGVRILGWESKQMMRTFIIETGESLTGPWQDVQKYRADIIGPEEPNEPGEVQDFQGFYASSRFWRIVIADNYGAEITSFHGLQFYGVENEVLSWFEGLNMAKYCRPFVEKGFNQMSELAKVTEKDVTDIVSLPGHKKKIFLALEPIKSKYNMTSSLRWQVPPVNQVTTEKPLPEFSVLGDPLSGGELVLKVHGGAEIIGNPKSKMVSFGPGNPSRASFNNIALKPPGKYLLEVRSTLNQSLFLRAPSTIVVDFPPKKGEELDKVFQDLEDLLKI
ncbi:uncharacterized protein [Dysidea avara]|uniref:uncharacterized protein n=1 Tax=Dysidea avara TaxID=196820 RepID=UPI00332DBB77